MLFAFQIIRRLRRRAGEHFGTVCSTWVFMSRSSTGRYEFAPLGVEPSLGSSGDGRSGNGRSGKRMVAFCALIMLWSTAQQCSFVLEQPATSIMYLHPRMKQVAAWFGDQWTEIRTHMGAFGAPTPKPTALYSGNSWVKKLQRTLTSEQIKSMDPDVEMSVRDEMTGQVTGGKDLKSSQAYPVNYGLEVQEAFSQHDMEIDTSSEASASTVDEQLCVEDLWLDAGMEELCRWVGVPYDRLVL